MRMLLTGLLLMAAVMPVRAEIFMCEEDGRKVFSQQPCGKAAKAMNLSNEIRKLTLPEEIDEQAAKDICQFLVGAWDMAASSGRNQNASERPADTYDSLDDQVMGYVRERVANYQERVRADPKFQHVLSEAAAVLVEHAYDHPRVTPEATAKFKGKCLDRIQWTAGYKTKRKPRS